MPSYQVYVTVLQEITYMVEMEAPDGLSAFGSVNELMSEDYCEIVDEYKEFGRTFVKETEVWEGGERCALYRYDAVECDGEGDVRIEGIEYRIRK